MTKKTSLPHLNQTIKKHRPSNIQKRLDNIILDTGSYFEKNFQEHESERQRVKKAKEQPNKQFFVNTYERNFNPMEPTKQNLREKGNEERF